jgi:hypothetical protein
MPCGSGAPLHAAEPAVLDPAQVLANAIGERDPLVTV